MPTHYAPPRINPTATREYGKPKFQAGGEVESPPAILPPTQPTPRYEPPPEAPLKTFSEPWSVGPSEQEIGRTGAGPTAAQVGRGRQGPKFVPSSRFLPLTKIPDVPLPQSHRGRQPQSAAEDEE
jgi:hypothetical protein